MTELSDDLDAWCQSYVAAFSAYDSDGIGSHWAFPALIVSGRHNLTFKDVAMFNQNTSGLLGFYKRLGVAKATRTFIDALPMGRGTAAITVSDQMLDAKGNVLAAWQASYVLRQYNDVWLAIMANADGELAAWKARGTPLGS